MAVAKNPDPTPPIVRPPVGNVPVATPAPAAKPAPKPPKPVDILTATPQQLADMANAQIAQQMKDQQQPLIDQQARLDAQNMAHGQAIQGFTTALATLLGQIAPQVSSMYENAAGNQAAFAHGFSDQVQGRIGENQQAQNDFLAQMGAPAAAQTPAANVGDVTYGMGGFIPASTMSREGAAFGAAAALAPKNAAAQGLQDFTSNTFAGRAQDQTITDQISALAAKQPELVRQALMDLQDQQYKAKGDARATASQAFNEWATTQRLNQGEKALTLRTAGQKFDQWAKEQGLNIQWDQLTLAQQKAQVQQANQAANLALSQQRNAISQQRVNLQKQTVAQGWQRLTNQEKAAEKKIASGGFTAKQLQTYKGTALSLADNARQGATAGPKGKAIHVGKPTKDDPKGSTFLPPLTYDQAVREGRKEGIPLSILIPALNSVYEINYKVTPRGLVQVPKGEAPQGGAGNAKEQAVVTLVQQYLGVPYVWGGETPKGFDCSGLLQYVWGKSGVTIPRTTYDQFKAGAAVPKGALRPGDAVFFKGSDSKNGLPGHVGIYIGNGQFIEAPHSGASVRISNLVGRSDYMGARRYG